MITELDLTVLPSPKMNMGADVSTSYTYKKEMNPYPAGLPDSGAVKWNNRMNDFFKLFLKHQDKIIRVPLWGVTGLYQEEVIIHYSLTGIIKPSQL
jgi:endo-1,4-beta-xylanase